MNVIANFRRFRLNLDVFNASADLGYFTGDQHNYDVIISNFRGGGDIRTPATTTTADAHLPLPVL